MRDSRSSHLVRLHGRQEVRIDKKVGLLATLLVTLIVAALALKGSESRGADDQTLQGTLTWIVQLTDDTAARIAPGAGLVIDRELGVDPRDVADLGRDWRADRSRNYQDCDGLRNRLTGNSGWRATYVARVPVPAHTSPEDMLRRTEALWRDRGHRVARIGGYNPGRGQPVSEAVSLLPTADGPAITDFTLTIVQADVGASAPVAGEREGIIVAPTPCLPLQ